MKTENLNMFAVAVTCVSMSICYGIVATWAFQEPTCFWFHGSCNGYDVLFGDMFALVAFASGTVFGVMILERVARRRRAKKESAK